MSVSATTARQAGLPTEKPAKKAVKASNLLVGAGMNLFELVPARGILVKSEVE